MIFCFCNEVQLKEYLDWMNNEIVFLLGGYQFFVYEIFFLNFSFLYRCYDFQIEDLDFLQDRFSCLWYYIYKKDLLRFLCFILNVYLKYGGCYVNDNSFFRYCRDFINGGFNLNGVCEKFEIEVLMFKKKFVFDYCYIVEEK